MSPNSVIVNGVVLDKLEGIEEALLDTLQNQLPKLQRAVYMGEVGRLFRVNSVRQQAL